MLNSVVRMLDERVSFPYRYARLTENLAPMLNGVTNALDVGPGDGRLSRYLIEATGCEITGLDVYLQPRSYIRVQQYDGRVFPYQDASFDCVMMVDMLHHTAHIDRVLAEACRVSRRFVIIKDHFWENQFDIWALRIADYIGNIPYNVALPYNYLCLEEWKSLFRRHGLAELESSTFKYNPLEPAHHIMAKLEKVVTAKSTGMVAKAPEMIG